MGLFGKKEPVNCAVCGDIANGNGNKAIEVGGGKKACKACLSKAGLDDASTLKYGTTATVEEIKKRQGMTGDERAQYIQGIIEDRGEWEPTYQPSDNTPHCPKCGSTSISADKKGFGIGKAVIGNAVAGPIGLVAGNIGAKKVVVTCLNCGKQWTRG